MKKLIAIFAVTSTLSGCIVVPARPAHYRPAPVYYYPAPAHYYYGY